MVVRRVQFEIIMFFAIFVLGRPSYRPYGRFTEIRPLLSVSRPHHRTDPDGADLPACPLSQQPFGLL